MSKNLAQQYGKKVFDVMTREKREKFNRDVLKATYKAQVKYGFEMGTGKEATHNNEADAFKHVYMSWYLTHNYGWGIAEWLGNMHEDETPNAPDYERNMDLWNNQIGREMAAEMWKKYGSLMKSASSDELSELASALIWEKIKKGELITNPYTDKRKYSNMKTERLKDTDRVFYEGEYFDKMDEEERKRYSEHYTKYKNQHKKGFPTKEELDRRVAKGELIYVEEYRRSDGTKVSGYYRSYPE